jgi:hypothetical protein
MAASALYLIVDAIFISKTGFKKLFQPADDWGPLKLENKMAAVHLDNLEPFHQSKSRIDTSSISFSSHNTEQI